MLLSDSVRNAYRTYPEGSFKQVYGDQHAVKDDKSPDSAVISVPRHIRFHWQIDATRSFLI